MAPGAVIIVSGPSGSGKSTLIRGVLDMRRLPLRLAVSATTRPPRPGEIDGVHYYFWTRERFLEGVARNEFLEHAEVHGKHCYGTPRSEVEPHLHDGFGVILDIDVQGAAQVRPLYPDHLSVFITLPSEALYERRLRQRGEPEESIARRMATARQELARQGEYQHVIVNDVKERAIAEFHDLLSRHLTARRS